MVAPLTIGRHSIGPGHPCFVIAEAGVNHDGDLSKALRLVDAAVDARADAVKFQTFRADRLVTADAPQCEYQRRATVHEQSQLELLRSLELDEAAHRQILQHCQQRGILFLSTPFDHQSADLLDELGVAAFKISSGEITNAPFLRHVAAKGKPVIVSTGMCSLGDVEVAVTVLEQDPAAPFALLHCVSSYPAEAADVNLRAMATLRRAFNVPVGYSDHTLGLDIAWASVAQGACLLEKHFTLDRSAAGPDHAASLEPDELRQLVAGVRRIEQAVGDGRKRAAASEHDTARAARKSLVAACDIPAGTLLTEELIAIKRPGTGLPPSMRAFLLNRRTRCPIAAGTLLTREMVA